MDRRLLLLADVEQRIGRTFDSLADLEAAARGDVDALEVFVFGSIDVNVSFRSV